MIPQRNYFLLVGSLVLIGVGLIVMSIFFIFINDASQDLKKWAQRKELVASGWIDPLPASVTAKEFEKKKHWRGTESRKELDVEVDYWVTMEVATIGPMTRSVTKKVYESISEGEALEVYPVDGVYVTPALDAGDSERTLLIGKWIFLSFASLPILAGILGLFGFFCKKPRQQRRDRKIIQSTPPN